MRVSSVDDNVACSPEIRIDSTDVVEQQITHNSATAAHNDQQRYDNCSLRIFEYFNSVLFSSCHPQLASVKQRQLQVNDYICTSNTCRPRLWTFCVYWFCGATEGSAEKAGHENTGQIYEA